MITEDYVSFETAKLLKEKGFNEPCRLYYDKYHGCVPIFVEDSKLTEYGYKELVRNDQNSISDFIASAPSLYVTMKWLREVHSLSVEVQFFLNEENDISSWNYDIIDIITYCNKARYAMCVNFETYEEACEAAVKYVLENLL